MSELARASGSWFSVYAAGAALLLPLPLPLFHRANETLLEVGAYSEEIMVSFVWFGWIGLFGNLSDDFERGEYFGDLIVDVAGGCCVGAIGYAK